MKVMTVKELIAALQAQNPAAAVFLYNETMEDDCCLETIEPVSGERTYSCKADSLLDAYWEETPDGPAVILNGWM